MHPVENVGVADTSGGEPAAGPFGNKTLNGFDCVDEQNMNMVVEGEIEAK